MSMRLLSVTLAALALPGIAAAQAKKSAEEHPYAKAKVGDWVTYEMKSDAMGMKFESSMTMRVAAKDDKSVTLKTSGKFTIMGMTNDIPESEQKIDLTIPWDPNAANAVKDKKDNTKLEKLGEGKEKVKVGDKEYNCTWTKSKITVKVVDKEFVTESTVWTSTDFPLGMVKMETKSDMGSMTMVIKESGTGKK
jgi:hypothetical protein